MKNLCTLFIFIFTFSHTFAQIHLISPTHRIVFQRNNDNSGEIIVSGYYTQEIDRLEYQLGNNVWQVFESTPTNGTFSGSVKAIGGRYDFEIRGLFKNQVVGSAKVTKVGIGEVFLIAGQSNAQGISYDPSWAAKNDQVNALASMPNTPFSPLNINQLRYDLDIAPKGTGAWTWGTLGDRLVENLGVPVLFYNAALMSTGTEIWTDFNATIYGELNVYPEFKQVFQNIASQTGLRAILWYQGESESVRQKSADFYITNVTKIIDQTRKETGKDISWVIALNSFGSSDGFSSEVLAAQNYLISQVTNVYRGPNTDVIDYRADGWHLSGNQVITMGNMWYNSLIDNNIFNLSKPLLPTPFIKPTINCSNFRNNSLSLELPTTFKNYLWEANNQTNSTVGVSSGTWYAKMEDQYGNYIFSSPVHVNLNFTKPTINSDGYYFCEGTNATLSSQIGRNWSTNEVSSFIKISQPGDYWVSYTNYYGCEVYSDVLKMNQITRPLTPIINQNQVSGELFFTLTQQLNQPTYTWYMNGVNLFNSPNSPVLLPKQEGNYTLEVNGKEAQTGLVCASLPSKPITITFPKYTFFPNPVQNKILNLSVNKNVGSFTFLLYDLSGKLVYSNFVPESAETHFKFNIPWLDKGMYIGTITTETTRINPQRIIVE